jgi:hydrogenase maturation protease
LLTDFIVKVLIAGVGHPNLKDLSFGQVFLAHLKNLEWSDEIDLENLSFGAIAVLQWFQDYPNKYDKVIFVSAAERDFREKGTLKTYKWDFPEKTEAEVQDCVNESVTGIISLDNLLTILTYFKVLPETVEIMELEPVDTDIGFECSPEIEARFGEFTEILRNLSEPPTVVGG